MLVWIDLETTGLKATKEHVLEVAAIVTGDNLLEIARFHRVVYSPHAARVLDGHADFAGIEQIVVDMHTKTGLWRESYLGMAIGSVDRDLAAFITEHAIILDTNGKRHLPQLAGSTISFDRAFLDARLPKAHDCLHYRNLDVTTLNELARRLWPAMHEARPRTGAAHRAMADIEESIAVCKFYAESLGPLPGVLW